MGVTIIILFIKEYMDNTSPEVSEIYRRSDKYPTFDLYKEKFAPNIHLRDGKVAVPLTDYSKYISLKLVTMNLDGIGLVMDEKFTFEDLVECSKADPILNSFAANVASTKIIFDHFSMCISPKDPSKYYVASNAVDVPF